ncbi:acyl-homoserine-lactone synthase [Variovorax sp. LG9.2]|jgi:acyl homoserine lactone synthase|uniref:acyl-homoserine-lactone synthase n=2 Tax=unclassified Variovorax TaxID=663243 RepID=UPI002B22B6EC|nr:acyl-homoserine-lactone synthase [Variovorax sp. LG9.2]MEB0113932.1 acyl-homoserine-lactone synthase [Variovorax sp. RTB1]
MKQMEILAGRPGHLAQHVLDDVGRYRYKVFVETLGWDLVTHQGLEKDQFDHDETLYIAARDEAAQVVGVARLLPTTSPYLLGEVFPQLLGGAAPPCDSRVWELSRFAAVDFNAPHGNALSQFSSEVAVGLLEKAIEVAAAHGAERIITVSPLGIERLLRREGFQAHRAAPPMIVDGHPIFACWIEVEARRKAVAPAH